jgi:methylphosphotriester-DNA--protein-cysteine methyltransferase
LSVPGQGIALSRLTEVLFVEVLRNWINSLGPGQGGWLGAISDPHIGSAFSARFTKFVGQPMQRYLIARRMMEAAFLLETSNEGIARIASRVGHETATTFSKLFHRHHGLAPGRYRATRHSDDGRSQGDVPEAATAPQLTD